MTHCRQSRFSHPVQVPRITDCLKQDKMTIASGYSGSCFLRPLQHPSSQLDCSSPGPPRASPSLPSASGSAAHRSLSSPHLSSTFNSSPPFLLPKSPPPLFSSLSPHLSSLSSPASATRVCEYAPCSDAAPFQERSPAHTKEPSINTLTHSYE